MTEVYNRNDGPDVMIVLVEPGSPGDPRAYRVVADYSSAHIMPLVEVRLAAFAESDLETCSQHLRDIADRLHTLHESFATQRKYRINRINKTVRILRTTLIDADLGDDVGETIGKFLESCSQQPPTSADMEMPF